MTVKEIKIEYCKEHYPEANGLVNCGLECGCHFENICLYDINFQNCQPGKYSEEDRKFHPV